MKKHGVSHYSRDVTIVGLADSIGKHLEDVKAKLDAHSRAQDEWNAQRSKMEIDLRIGMDKREQLDNQLEEARKERDAAKAEVRILENRLKVRPSNPIMQGSVLRPSLSAGDRR